MIPRTERNAVEASTFNRWRIWDSAANRWMHIGYDTRESARRAAAKMNQAENTVRYIARRTEAR